MQREGMIALSQQRLVVDGLLRSAHVQFVVTAHLQGMRSGANFTADSTALMITLPMESEKNSVGSLA